MKRTPPTPFDELTIEGELWQQEHLKRLYATDASPYRETPLAVAFPKNSEDISRILSFCREKKLPIIPRAAGTSIAGQVVGSGLVVDISRHFRRIGKIDKAEQTVWVEPGVVLDELNLVLKDYGLLWGPETSTSNRCTLGGMVGNNSCGSRSLIYGSVRDHLLEVKGYLSDGSPIHCKPLSKKEFREKLHLNHLEGDIYRFLHKKLSNPTLLSHLHEQFPHPEITRRNTGYALDSLAACQEFEQTETPFNLSKLIAGSEGTLLFITEIKLHLEPLPPPCQAVICAHFNSLHEALKGNLTALEFAPRAVELLDDTILRLALENPQQRKNRHFIQGHPKALLSIEFRAESREALDQRIAPVVQAMKKREQGTSFPVLYEKEVNQIWALRKAGLGTLFNVKGDAKPVALIEDMALRPQDLPAFVKELEQIIKQYQTPFACFGHAASGEIHFRPLLNLKQETGRKHFKAIGEEVAHLVKKYRGSLSGEHGDGRLRGAFIPIMVGENLYRLFCELKQTFDPQHLLNPHKITDTPPIASSLRYTSEDTHLPIKPFFRWEATQGSLLQALERCNGSGDCRKPEPLDGVLCPTYKATLDERYTTRARANLFREYLTLKPDEKRIHKRDVQTLLQQCLACKGCQTECPSNVDMAKLKAEFLFHHKGKGIERMQSYLISRAFDITRLAYHLGALGRSIMENPPFSSLLKKIMGFTPHRNFPLPDKISLKKWYKKKQLVPQSPNGKRLYFLNDELSNYTETEIGKATLNLLHALGYTVQFLPIQEVGRARLSKGYLQSAKKLAEKNITLWEKTGDQLPIVGTEPSTLLTFRDEYLDLVSPAMQAKAQKMAKKSMTIIEFLAQEVKSKTIQPNLFHPQKKTIYYHAHCYEKALSNPKHTQTILSLTYSRVRPMPVGCCGMAGSFGYEKKNYPLSVQVAQTSLLPALEKLPPQTHLAASGTSCRHQIKDLSSHVAKHPVEWLWLAFKKNTEVPTTND